MKKKDSINLSLGNINQITHNQKDLNKKINKRNNE
jgi:hypothetical protein